MIQDELKASNGDSESEQVTDFNAFHPKQTANLKKDLKVQNSKLMTGERLDQNLYKFQGKSSQANTINKIKVKPHC